MSVYDIAIVGAGIAGASLASRLADHRSVLLIEAEAQPGYHATGRSAAFWTESYGGPDVQPLTSASHDFLAAPPAGFHDRGFLTQRGALHLARAGQEALLHEFTAEFTPGAIAMARLDRSGISRIVPGLRSGWNAAVYEPDCSDIDVAALHGAYLADARRKGARLVCSAEVQSVGRANGRWTLDTKAGAFEARLFANAAGAWADPVAELAGVATIGIAPMKRTIAQLRVDPPAPADLPLVIGIDGSFYFKPGPGGRLWLSPHDEQPCAAGDVAADEIDIAIAIDRLRQAVDWRVAAVERKWAGLRSFAPDRLPVIGRDPAVPDFFWFAGQGGFGIQTAPACAGLAASRILETPLPGAFESLDPVKYAPERLR